MIVQYIIIGILFAAAVAWVVIRSIKSFSTKADACNKNCGCAEVKK